MTEQGFSIERSSGNKEQGGITIMEAVQRAIGDIVLSQEVEKDCSDILRV